MGRGGCEDCTREVDGGLKFALRLDIVAGMYHWVMDAVRERETQPSKKAQGGPHKGAILSSTSTQSAYRPPTKYYDISMTHLALIT